MPVLSETGENVPEILITPPSRGCISRLTMGARASISRWMIGEVRGRSSGHWSLATRRTQG